MKITFNEAKAIVDTLPIGFYAERKISATLVEEAECSCYDPKHDTIEIAYPQLLMGLDKLTDESKVEMIIRSNYYHEVAHAILTPKNMWNTDWRNIFEDERIETLLNGFFYGTDFKEAVKLICGYEEKPTLTNPLEAFFYLVRFRKGDPKLLQEVKDIIHKAKHLSRNRGEDKKTYYHLHDYCNDIDELYRKFCKECPKVPAEIEDWFEKFEGEDKGEGKPIPTEMDGDPTDTSKDSTDSTSRKMKKVVEASDTLSKEEFSNAVDDMINALYDHDFHQQLKMVFECFRRKNSKGSCLNGYSGVLNPRCADRKDYRIFERSTTARGNNQFGSFHLNLFIDTSGSFSRNDEKCNTILHSLALIEQSNPNFTFDIVTMSEGEKLLPKEDRYIRSNGGNHLSGAIFDLYHKLQIPQTYNYNLVLFDGNAYSNDVDFHRIEKRLPNGQGFSCFANNNCTIISDYDNKSYIEKFAPTTRTIYTHDYCGTLLENVLKVMQKALS